MTDNADSHDGKSSVRERILAAAVEAFASSGFAGTRVGEIAVKAKVNQALIYYYFESKERLYQEVLNGLFAQWEAMLSRLDWEGKDVTAFVREYIRAQYEMKVRMPHLYKIFHWETLEGGGLFEKYASPVWTQDFYDIAGKLAGWKTEGAIRPQANEKVLLFLMFGMMDQFYFRRAEGLASILGKDGSEERLHADVVEEMVALTLHGVLPKAEPPRRGSGRPIVTVLAEGEAEVPEARQLLEALKDAAGAELRAVDVRAPEKALANDSGLVLLLASTSVGEMPAWIRDWLAALARNRSAAEGRAFAIWTIGEGAAPERLQRLLEETFNELGGFAVSRLRGQSPGDYAKRCMSWIKAH
ncbi:TetR family transcriptional regulator [Cohnella thailandensis]|uniref:TetR family transcriptional regulator n=1 Tax=Cohnella thailandensis TaxID=557557 RepID=A0A841SZI4_9BACL|nr:TetR family transcriptional regulator [Cohnella thailandensis]MBP1973752.1 AcrR family transcriptional regulator [Cohnella thailandensis]